MQELNPLGKRKVYKTKLIDKGFDFDYFTNIYQTRSGNIYYFCYEFGYLPLKNNYYSLVKNLKLIPQQNNLQK